jgi:hypothetical protein
VRPTVTTTLKVKWLHILEGFKFLAWRLLGYFFVIFFSPLMQMPILSPDGLKCTMSQHQSQVMGCCYCIHKCHFLLQTSLKCHISRTLYTEDKECILLTELVINYNGGRERKNTYSLGHLGVHPTFKSGRVLVKAPRLASLLSTAPPLLTLPFPTATNLLLKWGTVTFTTPSKSAQAIIAVVFMVPACVDTNKDNHIKSKNTHMCDMRIHVP